MRLRRGISKEEILADFREQATRAWGAEALPAMESALDKTAGALAMVFAEPIEPMG